MTHYDLYDIIYRAKHSTIIVQNNSTIHLPFIIELFFIEILLFNPKELSYTPQMIPLGS